MAIPVVGVRSRQLSSSEPVRPGHFNDLRSDTLLALRSLDVGDDADKEASPDAGRAFIASDTGKLYVALSAGSWTDISDVQNLTNEDLYLLKDGTRALTGDWSYGSSRKISGGKAEFTSELIIPAEA